MPRLSSRVLPLLAGFVLAVVASAVAVVPVRAAEVETGGAPRVRAGHTVDDDLYLFGGGAEVDGAVAGDVVVSAGSLEVDGRIDGSLSVAAGTVEVRGEVGRSLRATAGTLRVFGRISGDVVAAGGTIVIEPGATVDGDLVAAGGDVEVRGEVGGEVRGNIGTLTIAGPVGGDVRVSANRVRLEPEARLAGALRYRGHADAAVDPGAVVAGPTVRRAPSRFFPGDNLLVWLGSAIFRLLCGLVAGAMVVLVMPRAAAAIADGLRVAPLAPFLVGVSLAIFVPLGIAVLLLTVVGIPIALVVLALFLVGLYLSQVVVGLAVGRFLLPNSWDTASRGFNLLAMTIGVILLAALRLIPVPYLSLIVATLTGLLGLGAVVVGVHRWREKPAR